MLAKLGSPKCSADSSLYQGVHSFVRLECAAVVW